MKNYARLLRKMNRVNEATHYETDARAIDQRLNPKPLRKSLINDRKRRDFWGKPSSFAPSLGRRHSKASPTQLGDTSEVANPILR